MRAAAADLQAKGAALVLVKGGHLAGTNGRAAVDVACDGATTEELESEVVRWAAQNWSVCTLILKEAAGAGKMMLTRRRARQADVRGREVSVVRRSTAFLQKLPEVCPPRRLPDVHRSDRQVSGYSKAPHLCCVLPCAMSRLIVCAARATHTARGARWRRP